MTNNDEFEALYEQAVAIEDDHKRRGLVIEGNFRSWWHMKLADGCPPEAENEFRACWYAANVSLFKDMVQEMSGRGTATDADEQFIQNLTAEMENFRQWATKMVQSQ